MTRDEALSQCDDLKYESTAFQNWYINLIDKIYDDFEKEYSELQYKFECVLDNATGGRASKSNIDLGLAYKLISDNTNFWVESALAEIEQPKTCEGCKHFRPNTDDEHEHCAIMTQTHANNNILLNNHISDLKEIIKNLKRN